jgi:hypothetical protein
MKMPLWAAALVVTGIYLILAIATALFGKSLLAKAASPLPSSTVGTIRDDLQGVQKAAQRGRQ